MRRVALLALLTSAACQDPLAPDLRGEVWEPPAVYEQWYEELEVCVGVTKPYDRVRWFILPGESVDVGDGRVTWAFYYHGAITLMAWVPETPLLERWIVDHEFLHYLLDPRRGHPEPPFGTGPGACEWLGYDTGTA